MKYRYQVVVHTAHYPSSILFESYEEALEYYNDIKGADNEECFVTLTEIKIFKGENPHNSEFDWYIDKHSEKSWYE